MGLKDPDRSLCSDLQRMAELRPQVFREPELLEAIGEILTGRGAKTAIQSSGGREAPCVAQAAACAMLTSALKVCIYALDSFAGDENTAYCCIYAFDTQLEKRSSTSGRYSSSRARL